MALTENRPLTEVYVNCQTSSVGTTPIVARTIAPVRGRILKVYSVLGGVITAADATVTVAINGTTVTGGAITIAQSGSAANDVDVAVPTALNFVNEGDAISFTPAGATGSSIPAFFTAIIERD